MTEPKPPRVRLNQRDIGEIVLADLARRGLNYGPYVNATWHVNVNYQDDNAIWLEIEQAERPKEEKR